MCGFEIASYILGGHHEAWTEESVLWQLLGHHFIMEFWALTCLRKIPLLLPPGSDFDECLPTPAPPLLLLPLLGHPVAHHDSDLLTVLAPLSSLVSSFPS